MSDDFKAVRVRVTGQVQGVGFRDWTRREALRLRLTGWVRNEHDGSVAALLVGSENAVASMLERLWTGPGLASVTDVRSEVTAVTEPPVDFRITR